MPAELPSYFEMLKLADRDAILQGPHTEMIKNGGALMVLTTVVLVIALLWFLLAIATWNRKRIGQSTLFALLGAAFGWVGSYVGYSKAAAVVAGSTTAPKPEELAQGATRMAYAAFAPTGVAVAIIVLAILASFIVRKRKEDPEYATG